MTFQTSQGAFTREEAQAMLDRNPHMEPPLLWELQAVAKAPDLEAALKKIEWAMETPTLEDCRRVAAEALRDLGQTRTALDCRRRAPVDRSKGALSP
jgi:hypothetical protein